MNTIHWASWKTVKSERESYGDRVYQTVEFTTTDLKDSTDLGSRLIRAVQAKCPFSPAFCTNQHSGFVVEMTGEGKGLLRWETYHSIGD